jgi:flagellar motor switch protein FliN
VNRAAKWIAEAWAEEFKAVLQFLTTEDWTVKITEPEAANSPASYFWWTQKFNVARGSQIAVGAPALAWSELGARVLQAAGVELIEQASARSTYLEAVQQSAAGVARAFTGRLSRSVEPVSGRDQPPEQPGHDFAAVLACGGFELPALRFVVSEELCEAFRSPEATVADADPGPSPVPAASPSSRTMSVLLDVQMPVSISFGKASMALRDVVKLSAGAAVELDRKPDDNVDIIVNNCVIAHGEVVVIDGNYGVRITQIISREQRLALRGGTRAC